VVGQLRVFRGGQDALLLGEVVARVLQELVHLFGDPEGGRLGGGEVQQVVCELEEDLVLRVQGGMAQGVGGPPEQADQRQGTCLPAAGGRL
jgi:hypothetical protein